MGATSSRPRTLVVNNDSPAGLIEISDDVVQRLKSGHPSKTQGRSADDAQQQPIGDGSSAPTARGPSSYPNPPVPPSVVYQGELPLTSMQVLQEKERELRENDVYWTQRLKALEANLARTNQVLEKEYSDAVADVKKRFATTAVQQQLPPCQDLKAKVIACYRQNPHETLRCAEEVKQFTDCVNQHRIQLLHQRAAADPGKK
ncbi:MICOS complex subunit MIC25 [Anopheles maculipalpis]|uniref:MICOS complex subunit MIC25 n=1 Tax=Anopheles maculipalpis TaxID=1496333 RepID=UPI0021590998|nr:MICOS complex subunit MIC25 [Anopheles maculipalpis]